MPQYASYPGLSFCALISKAGAAGLGAGAGAGLLDDCVSAKPFGAPPIFCAIPTALVEPNPGAAAGAAGAGLLDDCVAAAGAAGAGGRPK